MVKLKITFNHTYWRAQIESLGHNHVELNSYSNWALQKVYLKKLLSISPFFSKILKSDFNLLFLIKHRLEEIKIIKLNSHWQDTCRKNCYLLFLSIFVVTFCFDLPKKEIFSNFNEISLKQEENYFWNLFFSFIWCAT